VEILEARNVPSGPGHFPLVQVPSDPSPFINSPVSDLSEIGFQRTDNSEREPQVAVDPTNPRHIVGVWIQDAYRGIVAGVSFNGGNTWRDVVIPGTSLSSGGTLYPRNSDPWVSFSPNGDVYVSLLGFSVPTTSGPSALLVSKSTDGGLTWGAPSTIIQDDTSKFLNDKDSITADPTNPNFAYVTWTRFLNGNSFKGATMFSETADGGQTWSQPRTIFLVNSTQCESNQIVVLPNGTLVDLFCEIAYKNDAKGIAHFDLNISLISSHDQGQTWSKTETEVADIVPLADTDTVPGIGGLPNPSGGPAIICPASIPDFAVDPNNGNLYAVWEDARFSGLQDYSIAFSMSSDGGSTWSAPIPVNQTPTNIPAGDQQAFLPSVAVAANGTVAVSYYDLRFNTSGPALLTDYWLVQGGSGTDLSNPASWGNEERLTDTPFDMTQATLAPFPAFSVGEYEGLAAAGNSFDAFFSMPQDGDPGNIYFRDPVAGATTAGQPDSGAELASALEMSSGSPVAAQFHWRRQELPPPIPQSGDAGNRPPSVAQQRDNLIVVVPSPKRHSPGAPELLAAWDNWQWVPEEL
jgi:hypothetical protein